MTTDSVLQNPELRQTQPAVVRENSWKLIVVFVLISAIVLPAQQTPEQLDTLVAAALARAGSNRAELEKALNSVPAAQKKGMRFLIAHMPERDLETLSSGFLLENVSWAYRAWQGAPWHKAVPEEVFLNEVLPYANINERRDNWRKDFHQRFAGVVASAQSPSEAAARLNQHIFKTLGVKYSTKRPKPDQSPYESIEAGLASCTGLSILLIDACRSVGVPARFAGTPLWSDGSGNHSWVEIWDQGWHFTGAAEPTGDELNKGWFEGRAAKAIRDDAKRAIYAVSYKRTPQHFPLLWLPSARYVSAVNVSDRYTKRGLKIPEGKGRIRFRYIGADGERAARTFKILDRNKKSVFEARTNDERFDANDHITAILDLNTRFTAVWQGIDGKDRSLDFTAGADEELVTMADDSVAETPLDGLRRFLSRDAATRGALSDQPFAGLPLTRAQCRRARDLLWQDHVARILKTRVNEMKDRVISHGKWKMRFHYQVYGKKPVAGRSLYISMHGGGGAPARVNDQQWRNQQRLYQPEEGVYVAPRAPTDTWNLWHQDHIDPLFDRLIENMIVFEDVNPDRVYIMGYSAGGDGVYQLAPRMADRWAAAAMMAGHPNETSPLGLRNVPFILQMGGDDAAYKRNTIAAEWKQKLAKLRKGDPKGYEHLVKIYPGKGHWMDREDAIALPWMAKYERNLNPDHIVWLQDDVCQSRFYWLAVDEKNRKGRAQVIARCRRQKIEIETDDVDVVVLRLDDQLLDLDKVLTVTANKKTVFRGRVKRTIGALAKTLAERGDPKGMFAAEVSVVCRKK